MMTTKKKGNVTIKNFRMNKRAAINYYNNVKNKAYVEIVTMAWEVEENGYCVKMAYKKNK